MRIYWCCMLIRTLSTENQGKSFGFGFFLRSSGPLVLCVMQFLNTSNAPSID